MSFISAKQLIYTRVEPSYSPQRKSGYQTVYKTASLNDALVKQIEERIQCFIPKESLVRWQYFLPNPDNVVVTRTTIIESDPAITDSDGRSGAFLAHCLILSRQEFLAIRNNPFVVLGGFSGFLNDPVEMVKRFGQATGIADIVEIEAQAINAPTESRWPDSELLKLISLGIQAPEMNKRKESILLYGPSEEVRETLLLLFRLLPTQARLNCSFDTFIERCIYPHGYYWAVGVTTADQSSTYLPINVEQKLVLDKGSVSNVSGGGLYISWLTDKIANHESGEALKNAEEIERYYVAFEEGDLISSTLVNESATSLFFDFNQGMIKENLYDALVAAIGKELTHASFDYVWKRTGEIAVIEVLDIASTRKWQYGRLSAFILDWMLASKSELSERELERIKDLARRAGNMQLLLKAALSSKKADKNARNEALSKMNRDNYERALDEYLFNPAEPADLVVLEHVPLLLTDYRMASISDQQFVDLVRAILESGAGAFLQPFATRVKNLNSNSLIQIETLLNKTQVDPEFQQAVSIRRAALGKPKFIQRLRNH